MKIMPKQIDIILDNKCNLTCINCIQPKINSKIKFNYAKVILDIIKISNNKEIDLNFTGNEPLISYKEIEKIINIISFKNKSNIRTNLYTNLTILNNDIIKMISKYSINIHLSLDGLEKANDSIRGEGIFKIIVKNINILNNNNITIESITTTIKDLNFNDINNNFIKFIKDQNISKWRLNIDYYGLNKSPKIVIDKILELYNNAKSHMLVEGTWLYPFWNIINNDKRGFCPAAKGDIITILPDGSYHICPFSNQAIGTIKDDYAEILNKNITTILYKNFISSLDCTNCFLKEYCNSHCLCTLEEDDKELNKWYCDIYRGITKRIFEKYINSQRS